jgi:hypothetical protein
MTCQLKWLTLQGTASGLKEVGQVGDHADLTGKEEEASQDMQGSCSNNCCGSITILDNFLTVGECVGGGGVKSKLARHTHTQEVS